jgi:MFS family permease
VIGGSSATPATAGRALRVVLTTTFLIRFAFGLTLSVFASYLSGTSVGFGTESIGTIGAVAALAPAGEITTVLLSGELADHRGRFPVLLVSIAGGSLLLALFAVSRDPLWLGGLNFLFGVASGGILTSSLAVVGDEAAVDARGLEMGRFDAMNLLGWILGFATGFALLGQIPNGNLAALFLAGGAVLAVGFTFAWRSLRGVPEPARVHAQGLVARLRAAFRREILLVTLPWLVIYLLLGTLFVFLGGAAAGAGLPTWELGLLIGVGGLVLLATQPYFGRLADRFGRMRLMVIGTIGFVGVLTGAGWLATGGVSPGAIALVGVSALPALAYGPAALAALTDVSRTSSRATTMGVYTMTISLGMLIGLLVSTGLFDDFGAAGLDVYFGLIAFGLILLTALRYRERPTPDAGLDSTAAPTTTPAR